MRRSAYLHYTFATVFGAFLFLLGLGTFYEIEVVVTGSGRVLPVGQVQLVQAENLARIKAIHVKNGEYVKKNQLLVELDSTQAQTDFDLLLLQERTLLAQQARNEIFLSIIENGGDISKASEKFSNSVVGSGSSERDQLKLLVSELRDFKNELYYIEKRKSTTVAAVGVVQSDKIETIKSLELTTQKYKMSRVLFEKGVYSRSSFLEIEAEIQAIQRSISIKTAEISRGLAQVEEFSAEIAYKKTNKAQILVSEINDIRIKLREIENTKEALLRAIRTNQLHAPMSGFVANLEKQTISGIVQASETIMTIVPDEDIYIEAFFVNRDVGFLEVEQQANIKLAAFPAARFGFLSGKVKKISSDSIERGTDNWGYLVQIVPQQDFLLIRDQKYRIRPGMTAQIDVVTNHRAIIEYFLAPIWEVVTNGLRDQ